MSRGGNLEGVIAQHVAASNELAGCHPSQDEQEKGAVRRSSVRLGGRGEVSDEKPVRVEGGERRSTAVRQELRQGWSADGRRIRPDRSISDGEAGHIYLASAILPGTLRS